MAQPTAQAVKLSENCEHKLVTCPLCKVQFVLSVYRDDMPLKQAQLVTRLRLDHDKAPGHAESIQL
jgi:hypothetical protein